MQVWGVWVTMAVRWEYSTSGASAAVRPARTWTGINRETTLRWKSTHIEVETVRREPESQLKKFMVGVRRNRKRASTWSIARAALALFPCNTNIHVVPTATLWCTAAPSLQPQPRPHGDPLTRPRNLLTPAVDTLKDRPRIHLVCAGVTTSMAHMPIPTPTSGTPQHFRVQRPTPPNPPRRHTRPTRLSHPRPCSLCPTPAQAGRVQAAVEQPAPAKTQRPSTPFVLRCSRKAVQSVLGNHVSVSPGLSGTECTIVVERLLDLQVTTSEQ